MSAFQHLEEVNALRERHVILLALDHLPRTTRAQPMDALSSQATVAGYKAALLAAELSPRLFPMLTTAAGTIRPSRVLVIGAGVAGLQAIATAKRLGAQVDAYDIRRAAKEQIESVGARMVDTGAKAHVVICAASIPGRRAPRIITEDMVDGMLPESVIVDMAASTGGNCELTRIGEHYMHNETLIVGPLNLPSHGAVHASEMYARNVYNMLQLIIVDGKIVLSADDEIIAGCVLLHDGQIHDEGTAKLLNEECFPFGGVVHSANDLLPDPTSGWLSDEDENELSESAQEVSAESHTDSDTAYSGQGAGDSSEGSSDTDLNSTGETASMDSGEVVGGTNRVDLEVADVAESASTAIIDSAMALDDPQTIVDEQSLADLQKLDGVDIDASADENDEPPDDLTLIEGVGPALQERLYAFGYFHWQDLANLDEESIEKLSVQLELDEQITEQDWSGQASKLLESKQ